MRLFSKILGGHDLAAGFIAESSNFEKIRDALDIHFQSSSALHTELPVEAFLDAALLNFESVDFLRMLGPFGSGNENPVFGFWNAEILDFSFVGAQKNHVKLTLVSEKKQFSLIAFFAERFAHKLRIGETVDTLFTLSDSYWNNQRRLEMRVVDMRESLN